MGKEIRLEEAIELYELAPCGYVSTSLDGVLLRANRTFLRWVGLEKEGVLDKKNLREFLTRPSQILYDTHYASQLQLQGSVGDIALELSRPGKTPLYVLVSSLMKHAVDGSPAYVNTTLFDMSERRRYEHELRDARRRAEILADVVQHSLTPILTVSFDLEIKTWNDATERLFSNCDKRFSESGKLEAYLPESCITQIVSVLDTNTPKLFEHVFNEDCVCKINAYPISEGVAIFFDDITQDRAAQKALQEANDRFNLATLATTDGIWDWNCSTGEIYTSQKIQDMLGIAEESAVLSMDEWLALFHPADRHRFLVEAFSAMRSNAERMEEEYRLRHCKGGLRWIQFRALALRSSSGSLLRVVASVSDITKRKFEDPLTHLHTKLALVEALEQCIGAEQERQRGCALLAIDLDGFRRINDGFGHSIGDRFLLEFAQRLQLTNPLGIEPQFFRLRGDEFAVFLDQVEGVQDPWDMAVQIHGLLERPISIDQHSVTISASVGIALSRPYGGGPEDLLRNANLAMHKAKSEGKGRTVVFTDNMHKDVVERIGLENDLREAIAEDVLTLHYQPKIALKTNRVIGFEALGRWTHPTRGIIPPDIFITLAEESDLIRQIGRWTLREAIRQLARWRRSGMVAENVSMAINLSPKQFGDPEIVDILKTELLLGELPPSCIELEITEGVLIGDSEKALQVMKVFRSIGVRLGLDDFGKGYSSLSYLHRYPFNVLKVDRAFVSRLDSPGEGEAIARSIVSLGMALKMEVVAEGIETEEQLRSLQEMGCCYGQGYLFSRALPVSQAEEFLRQSQSFSFIDSERNGLMERQTY